MVLPMSISRHLLKTLYIKSFFNLNSSRLSASPLGLKVGCKISSQSWALVEFWGLPPLILFFNTSTGWFGRFVLSTECYRTRKLDYNDLSWPRCSAWVTEFGTNRWRFLSKANTLYFRLCKICEFMKCIWIVNHQLNRMHPWCSWECMLPGRCSPGKRCHTFWNRNIVLLPILLGKVSCVPEHTLCELYGVKVCE